MLAHAFRHPDMLGVTANAGLIKACQEAGLLDAPQAATLLEAHAELLHRALACTLDLRSRITLRDAPLQHLCEGVEEVTEGLGFRFGTDAARGFSPM